MSGFCFELSLRVCSGTIFGQGGGVGGGIESARGGGLIPPSQSLPGSIPCRQGFGATHAASSLGMPLACAPASLPTSSTNPACPLDDAHAQVPRLTALSTNPPLSLMYMPRSRSRSLPPGTRRRGSAPSRSSTSVSPSASDGREANEGEGGGSAVAHSDGAPGYRSV